MSVPYINTPEKDNYLHEFARNIVGIACTCM